jgi:hypothetical protein
LKFRTIEKAVTLLDMGHLLWQERTLQVLGKGKKPKTWMWWMLSLYWSKYSNLKLAEATMGRGLESSEEVW